MACSRKVHRTVNRQDTLCGRRLEGYEFRVGNVFTYRNGVFDIDVAMKDVLVNCVKCKHIMTRDAYIEKKRQTA